MKQHCQTCDMEYVCCGRWTPDKHGEAVCCDNPIAEFTCTGVCGHPPDPITPAGRQALGDRAGEGGEP